MIKKIDKYLLTHHPIVWNLRLVPTLLIVISLEILLFAFAYSATDNTIKFSSKLFSESYVAIYAISLLLGLLIFIFWLLRYNKNNALKAFYPHSNTSLYFEWLFIFIICLSIGFIPNSLSMGKNAKWKSAASQTEYKEAMRTIHLANTLHPSSIKNYEPGSESTPMLVGNADVDRTRFNTTLYNYEEDALSPANPIEYIGPSFLYFKDNRSYYYWRNSPEENTTVHKWLVEGQVDSIRATMQAYIDLHKKNNVETNLDVDSWMKMVYNPPFFPVDELIQDDPHNTIVYENMGNSYSNKKLLSNYYEEIEEYYGDNDFDRWFLIVTLTIALLLSVSIFSSRVTSGRTWIMTILTIGVISIGVSIFSGISLLLSSASVFALIISPLFWLILFVVICFIIGDKIMNKKSKGRRQQYMVMAIWYIPCLIPLLYQLLLWGGIFSDSVKDSITDGQVEAVAYASIIFTVVVMYPAIMVIRKWKALPED